MGTPTFEFVFAYVEGRWRVDSVGGEVVDHVIYIIIESDKGESMGCCTRSGNWMESQRGRCS